MSTRRWLAGIWLAFTVRLLFYAAAYPIWEGFDEWAHFAVVRQMAAGHPLPARDSRAPLDVAASLELASVAPAISNLPGAVVTHEQFWRLPVVEQQRREEAFRALPADYVSQASALGAYETLQPPLYYWLMTPLLRLLRHAPLAAQVFALRWAAVALGSLVVPLLFLLGRAVFRDERLALGCAVVGALMPELAVTTARVSNECLAIPLYTALTWIAVRRRNWIAMGVVLGLGLITKAYFLAAAVGALAAFWAPRSLLIAAGISGWWYVRNWLTTGTVSGLSEAVTLRGTPAPSLLRTVETLPWGKAIDSILFSNLYFGGWSSLMARSWMYHLLYLVIAVAAVGLVTLLRRREIQSLVYIYGVFWIAQLYNAVLIFATKGVPTSMGWYLYAVAGAQVALCMAGLRRWIGAWAIAVGAVSFGLLDLYAMHALALPYYTGLLGRKANGALAGLRFSDAHPAEVFHRLAAFKPEYVTAHGLMALWGAYAAATVGLIAAGVWLSMVGAARKRAA